MLSVPVISPSEVSYSPGSPSDDQRSRVTALLEASDRAVASDPAGALLLAQKAYSLAEPLGDSPLTARCLRAEGIAFLWKGDFPQAISRLRDACERSARTQDRQGEAAARNAIGVVYTKMGDPAAALTEYRLSLELRRAIGDTSGQAMTLHNIGIEHRALGDLPAARSLYEQALAIDRETGDRIGEGRTLLSLGTVRYLMNDAEGAAAMFRDALSMSRETGDRTNEAQAMLNLGEAEAALGNLSEALQLHLQCLQFSNALGSPDFEASAQSALGKTHRLRGEYGPAEEALRRSLYLSEQVGARRVQSEAWEELSLIHEANGDFQAALHAYRRYHQIERDMLSEEAERRARTLSTRIEIEQARHEATLDPLTGLANRRGLKPYLQEAFAHTRRTGKPLAVAVIDIDNFKKINDTLTHSVGDAVLRQVARLLEQGCRAGQDRVARYGGEEFVLLLPGLSPTDAAARCEQIRAGVERYLWHTLHPSLERVTISVGVCSDTYLPHEEALLAAADGLLYEAKRAGKNRVAR